MLNDVVTTKEFVGQVLQRREPYEQAQGFLIPPREVALGLYRRMAQTDATIAACLEFVTTSALTRLGDYSHPDARICEFVKLNFELLAGSFTDTCRDLLSCLWAGFSVAEIVTELKGGMIWLHSLPLLPCETVTFRINEDTENINYGEIEEIIQRPYQVAEARLPVGKCVVMKNRYSGAVNNDPYGMSRLQVVLGAWKRKEQLTDDWNCTLSNYALPLIKYKLDDPEAEVQGVNGESEKAYKAAARQIRNWTNKNNGFIYGEGNDLDFIFPPGSIGDAFDRGVMYWDRIIMRGLLIPSLLFEAGDVGSYALGQEHMALFQQGLDALISNLTETLLEQLIRPLITVNFGEQSSWGTFEVKESRTELEAWANLLTTATTTGAIDVTRIDDLNTMRSKLGFEPLTEDELPAITKAIKAVEEEDGQAER